MKFDKNETHVAIYICHILLRYYYSIRVARQRYIYIGIPPGSNVFRFVRGALNTFLDPLKSTLAIAVCQFCCFSLATARRGRERGRAGSNRCRARARFRRPKTRRKRRHERSTGRYIARAGVQVEVTLFRAEAIHPKKINERAREAERASRIFRYARDNGE